MADKIADTPFAKAHMDQPRTVQQEDRLGTMKEGKGRKDGPWVGQRMKVSYRDYSHKGCKEQGASQADFAEQAQAKAEY